MTMTRTMIWLGAIAGLAAACDKDEAKLEAKPEATPAEAPVDPTNPLATDGRARAPESASPKVRSDAAPDTAACAQAIAPALIERVLPGGRLTAQDDATPGMLLCDLADERGGKAFVNVICPPWDEAQTKAHFEQSRTMTILTNRRDLAGIGRGAFLGDAYGGQHGAVLDDDSGCILKVNAAVVDEALVEALAEAYPPPGR